MAEAEQPQIDDLKRLLKRLEQATPEKSDTAGGPVPPPLPKVTVTEAKPPTAATDKDGSKKDLATLSAQTSRAAPGPSEAGGRRPMLTWLAAGASTAALAVAALAGLQSSHPPFQKMQQTSLRPDGAMSEKPAHSAPLETAATSTTALPASAAPSAAATTAPSTPPPAPAEAAIPPAAATPDPPAQTAAAPNPPAPSSGPIPESPTLRAAAPVSGRDKYESEARLDAYLERGQKLLDEGDLTAARSFFRRVAESGDPRGALALGATYDSNYSNELGIRTAQPDNTVAGEWYRRAMELGSKDALDRLERLEK